MNSYKILWCDFLRIEQKNTEKGCKFYKKQYYNKIIKGT